METDGSGSVTTATYNSKWKLEFSPGFTPGAIYPEVQGANSGYQVKITVADQSGNESDEVIRYLQVGDFLAPTLTLIGKSEIHDFLRFKSPADSVNTAQSSFLSGQGPAGSSGFDGINTPFLDQTETDKNREYNATGFNSLGSHRILYADYDFVDPGVYAEDDNAYYDVDDNYPDLDGDGIGEGHAFVNVYDRPDMVDCSQGPGVIHIYSWFKQEIMG